MIDLNSSAAPTYADLQYSTAGGIPGSSGSWHLVGGPTVLADDKGTSQVTQNSVNYGFAPLLAQVDSGGYHFGPGTFDIVLQAYDLTPDHNLLAQEHIKVTVS